MEIKDNDLLKDGAKAIDKPVYSEDMWRYTLAARENKALISNVKFENPRYTQYLNAVANRDFGALQNSQRVIGLGLTQTGHTGIQPPEFDLIEQAAVYDAEPLTRSAIQRQINLWFKEAPQIIGTAPKYTEYIEKRMKQIAFVTKIHTNQLFKGLVRNLLKYSNAFLIIVRNENLSGGVKRRGKAPIAGLIPVSPLSMYPKYENGKLIYWIRLLKDGTKYQEFPVDDVIHFTFDQEDDFLFGKPRMLGAIEDVAALRRMEENVEILIAKYLFPIFQLKVGTEARPCEVFPDGTSELDAAKYMVQGMEQEGMMVTSERHELDVVGALDHALDARHYLKHFQDRLFMGMGVSSVDLGLGDTANRATADSISQNLKDRVIEDQQEFINQVQMKIFLPLFLEHPEELSVLNAFDAVKLRFHNVDLDNRIKYENHVINSWNNNLIAEPEAREGIGRKPMTDEDRAKTRFNLNDVPLAVIGSVDEKWSGKLGKQALSNAGAGMSLGSGENNTRAQATGTGNNRAAQEGGKTSSAKPSLKPKEGKNPGQGETRIKSQPTNQHGTNPGPTKAKSSYEKRFTLDEQLIGKDLSYMVSDLLLCDSDEEISNALTKRFPDKSDQDYILPVVRAAYAACSNKSELRAALVAGLTSIADKFREKDEE